MAARSAKLVLGVAISALIAGEAFAGAVGPTPRDTLALARPLAVGLPPGPIIWFLRNTNLGDVSCLSVSSFGFGATGDGLLVADPDGDGLAQAAVFRDGQFFIRNSNDPLDIAAPLNVPLGGAGDVGIAGNFDASDAGDELGVFRSGQFFLLDAADNVTNFPLGGAGDIPLVGNWDGSLDGSDEVGVFRPSTNEFFLRDAAGNVTSRAMGTTGDVPLTGDWDRDGTTTIGVWRDGIAFVSNATSGGTADADFGFGSLGDTVVTNNGDLDGPATDDTTGLCLQ